MLTAGCVRVATQPPAQAVGDVGSSLAVDAATESGAKAYSPIDVVSIDVGDRYDFRSERLLRSTREPDPDSEQVYAVARLRNVPAPGVIAGRWVHLDSDAQLAEREIVLYGTEVEVRFSLARPTKGWPAGVYKFYLSANGEDVAGVDFAFRYPGEPTADAAPSGMRGSRP